MPNVKRTKYDLEDRTAKFGEKIIEFAKKIPKTEPLSYGSFKLTMTCNSALQG
jgi:hypothetical protein